VCEREREGSGEEFEGMYAREKGRGIFFPLDWKKEYCMVAVSSCGILLSLSTSQKSALYILYTNL